MSDNPFAAPNASSTASNFLGAGEFYRDGQAIVVTHGTELPHRCIRCNRELMDDKTARRETRKIYYASSIIYLLAVLNVLIFFLVWMFVRKPVSLSFSTCAEHHRQKIWYGLLSVASLFLMFACFIAGAESSAWMTLLGGIFFITFIVGLAIALRGPSARKHVKGQFWIHGLGKDFVNSIS